MLYGCSTPNRTGKGVSKDDMDEARNRQRKMAQLYTHFLGVPAVFVICVGSILVRCTRRR